MIEQVKARGEFMRFCIECLRNGTFLLLYNCFSLIFNTFSDVCHFCTQIGVRNEPSTHKISENPGWCFILHTWGSPLFVTRKFFVTPIINGLVPCSVCLFVSISSTIFTPHLVNNLYICISSVSLNLVKVGKVCIQASAPPG